MKSAPLPPTEPERLAALRRTNLLDTVDELEFDDLTLLASQICGTPIALISLVDGGRQWFKSRVGLEARQTPREHAFCAHAILQPGLFEVRDAFADERFADNPLVLGDPHVRFYAGEPIESVDGQPLGTLCVIDHVPRALTDVQRRALAALARHVNILLRQRAIAADLRETNAQLERATAQVSQGEARFRIAFEETAVGMAIVALNGRYLRVNAALCAMLGYTQDELAKMTIVDICHPSEVERTQGYLRTLPSSQGKLLNYEKRYLRKDGSELWVHVSTCCVYNAGGDPLYFVSHVQDISARRNAEAETERIRRTQTRLAATLEETSDLVAIVDPTGRVQFMNRAGRVLLGLEGKELPPTLDITSCRPSWAIAKLQSDTLPALEQHGMWKGESAFISPERGEVHVLQAHVVHRDAEGKPEFYSIIAHDISERRAIEVMKDEFVSTVSHELRTPLTSIRGALGLLEGGVVGDVPEQALEIVRIARTNCDRLVRLINDVLDLEKMSAGKLVLHPRDVAASEVVAATLDGVRAIADAAGVRLVAAVRDDLVVHADVDRIVQVLTNLVSNALKFSPRGADVDIVVERRAPARVRFTILDRGPGIPESAQAELFRPFHQVDGSDARPKGGTGLGLAISKAIVEEHKGAIGVESRVGVGSSFWFEIDAESAPCAEADPRKAKQRGVLVLADDDPMLADQGLELTRISLAALSAGVVERMDPSIVVADLGAHAGGAMAWLEQISRERTGGHVPTVLLVGAAGDGFSAPLLRHLGGADDPNLAASIQDLMRRCDGKTVLVVEDDPLMRLVLRKQLAPTGARVLEAADGDEAVRAARETHPDLIVLDVSLPKADGFAVIEALRGSALDTPVIVYTGRDLTSAERARLALGATRYFTKSHARESEFLRAVRELLGVRAA